MRPLLLLTALWLALLVAPVQAVTNGVVNLSHYDEMTVDFGAMRRAGILGVIHEVTYPPRTVDERYSARQVAATQADLYWGAYHFANASDPVRQADHFVDTVGAIGRRSPTKGGVLMVLDFELNTHYPGGTMTVTQAVAFIQRVKARTGKYPGVYSGENRIKAVLNGPKVTPAERRILQQCWLWVANYHFEPTALLPWGAWKMWQYTGDGVCDLPRSSHPKDIANIRNAERNFFRGSAGELAAFWRENAWQP